VVGVISPPLLVEPPGDLAGLVQAEGLVDPAWAQAGRGRDLADGQPRLMGFDDGPDPLPLSPFQAFRGQAELGGEPLLASDPRFQLVVGFHPSRPSIGRVAVQRTGRLRTRFIGAGPFFGARWGARGAECLPRDVRRRSSQATSRFDGSTAHRCLCVRTGSGIMEARPHPRALPPPRTTWPKSASHVYSVLQSKWPIRAPSRFEPVGPRERGGND
jgi:hypothetical protein